MTDYREQAIQDVAEASGLSVAGIERTLEMPDNWPAIAYAVAQRERVLELEARESDAHELARRAFVSGAKWWEWEKTGATMWGSDQAKAWDVAPDKYPYTNPADVQLPQKEGERG